MHLTVLQQVERLKRMTGEYKWNSTSTGNKIKIGNQSQFYCS